jgi:CRP/FNR family transcriptional regulator, cyclic AMP receptor protein
MIQNSYTLGRIPLFRTLAPEAVRRLDTQCAWRRVKARECVLDYKDRDTRLYFITQGHVRVLIRASSGKELILRDIRDGEYFGELAAIDGLPRSAAIVAVTDAIVAAMPPAVFRGLVHEHSDVCDQLLVLLASQIRILANRVNEHGTLDVRARIYAELLRLCRPAHDGDTRAVISPPPTHVELAARVSTRREAITRELKSLERAGLVERRRGAIVLLDTAQLAKMIERAGQ